MSSAQNQRVKDSFRIELRLETSVEGEQELRGWPTTQFTPDFAVAASGVVRIELAGEMIGSKDGKLMTVETRLAQRLQKDIDFWLPDYIGGFALNLGRAMQELREGRSQSKASFLDEPMLLQFRRQPAKNTIIVGFEANGKGIRMSEVSEDALYKEVGQALENFRQQLLKLNPRLKNQTDVMELTGQLEKLMERR